MTEQEILNLINQYDIQSRELGYERELYDFEYNGLSKSLNNIPLKYAPIVDLMEKGDYSRFSELPAFLRNYYGEREVKNFLDRFSYDFSLENTDVQRFLKINADNAVFRAGIRAGLQDSPKKAELDNAMNQYMLQKALTPPTALEVENIYNADEPVAKSNARLQEIHTRQRILAKTLFLAQLGQFQLRLNDVTSKAYVGDVAGAFAHGGRVNFILPHGGNQKELLDGFMSADEINVAKVTKQSGETYNLTQREVIGDSIVITQSKENQPTNDVIAKQYGVKLKVGKRESSFTVRKQEGDATHCGSLLVGMDNKFFLTAQGGVGRNIDGRVVDLSGIKPEELVSLLKAFDAKYKTLQNYANTPDGERELANVNSALCGKHMSPSDLKLFLGSLGLSSVFADTERSRGGETVIQNSLNASDYTREEFENIFRARTNSEQACEMARRRFQRANTCDIAVNAIKELQKIHNMRTFGWKCRHLISNIREYFTIKELMGKLYEGAQGKTFNAVDVMRAFKSTEDTYMPQYGEGLENVLGVNQIRTFANKFKVVGQDEAEKQLFEEMGSKASDIIYKKIQKLENSRIGKTKTTEGAKKTQDIINKDPVSTENRAEQDYENLVDELDNINEEINKKLQDENRNSMIIHELKEDVPQNPYLNNSQKGSDLEVISEQDEIVIQQIKN